MSLKFIDKRIIGGIIMDAFQEHFNTEIDPADGQWFLNGPDNNGGLYGSLVDTLASELVFLPNDTSLQPNKLAGAVATIDNRNGLTPKQTVTLSFSTTNTSSTTHSTTNAIKTGIGVDIKASGTFLGTGVDVTTKITTDYTFSWNEANTKTESEAKNFTQQVPTEVPSGKVYQVVLVVDKTALNAPYYADIILTGKSTANFASPVNGKKTWPVDAGTLCEWINKYGSAGDESYKYMRDPNNPTQGLIRLRGNLTASITANFTANTFDVTDSYNATGKEPIEANQSLTKSEFEKLKTV